MDVNIKFWVPLSFRDQRRDEEQVKETEKP